MVDLTYVTRVKRDHMRGTVKLPTSHPAIAAQWHPTLNGAALPADYAYGVAYLAWWQCDLGHSWQATINKRTQGRNCPYCSRRTVLTGFSDMASTHPQLAIEFHPTRNSETSPADIFANSNKRWWWQCSEGHEWEQTANKRAQGKNCPYCSGRFAIVGQTDLGTTYPSLTAEWHPTLNGNLTPQQVKAGSSNSAWWHCSICDHSWQSRISARALQGQGCPRCAILSSVSAGEKELAEVVQQLANEQPAFTSRGQLSRKNSELDIYLPKAQIGIEYNGVFWHSEAGGKKPAAHYNKWLDCAQHSIALLQIWEDDWQEQRALVTRLVASRIGCLGAAHKLHPDAPHYFFENVSAEVCTLLELDQAKGVSFLDEHHLLGSVSLARYFGLRDSEDRIRAVIACVRESGSPDASLVRYAEAGEVPGGLSALAHYACAQLGQSSIVAYAKLDMSENHLFEAAGFSAGKTLSPEFSYFVNKHREPAAIHPTGRGRTGSLVRVWDSGSIRYTLDVNAPIFTKTGASPTLNLAE